METGWVITTDSIDHMSALFWARNWAFSLLTCSKKDSVWHRFSNAHLMRSLLAAGSSLKSVLLLSALPHSSHNDHGSFLCRKRSWLSDLKLFLLDASRSSPPSPMFLLCIYWLRDRVDLPVPEEFSWHNTSNHCPLSMNLLGSALKYF